VKSTEELALAVVVVISVIAPLGKADPAIVGELAKLTTCAALIDIAVVLAVWIFNTPEASAVVITPPAPDVDALIDDAMLGS
jgi:hypothetical protein